MKEENTNTFRIHQYLNNNMTPKETMDFENEVKTNPVLAEEFSFHLNLKKASAGLYKPELLNVVSEQLLDKKKPGLKRYLIPLLILLAAICALYFTLFKKVSPQTNQELFAKHMSHFELSNYRNTNGELADLFKNYQDKSYNLVCDQSKLWNNETKPTLQKAFFVAGISCLQINELDQAINHLTVLPPTFLYYQDAQWYLALAHLKNDNKAASVKILENLRGFSAYQKRAEKLIKALVK